MKKIWILLSMAICFTLCGCGVSCVQCGESITGDPYIMGEDNYCKNCYDELFPEDAGDGDSLEAATTESNDDATELSDGTYILDPSDGFALFKSVDGYDVFPFPNYVQIETSTTIDADPQGDLKTVFFVESFDELVNVLEKDQKIAVVTSSDEPPTVEYLVKIEVSDFAVQSPKHSFSYSDSGLGYDYYENYLIEQINGNSDYDNLLYTVIKEEWQPSALIFVQGSMNESVTVSKLAGTQGYASDKFELDHRLVIVPAQGLEHRVIKLNYETPNNGYAVLNTSSLEPGYYCFAGMDDYKESFVVYDDNIIQVK